MLPPGYGLVHYSGWVIPGSVLTATAHRKVILTAFFPMSLHMANSLGVKDSLVWGQWF